MPWVKVPVTEILVHVKELHYGREHTGVEGPLRNTPVPKDEAVLEVRMGRGGAEWSSQEFTVRVGESFIIPLVEQGNEGVGRADTWPLENLNA